MTSMKRVVSATERNTVGAAEGFAFYSFLEVTDADSTPAAPVWKNIGAMSLGSSSADFLNACQITDGIDQNTLAFSATLAREHGVNYSLSPYRSNSLLNRRANSTFGPVLDIRRYWRIWACAMPLGVAPSSGNFRIWRDGRLDLIDVQEAASIIVIQGRGMEADLIDAYVAVRNRVYGGTPPVDVEDIIQKMLDDQMGTDIVQLYAPEAPIGFLMPEWNLDEGSLMPAIMNLATMAASVTRYRYDSADANRFTMFTPDRTPNPDAPDWTVGHTEYKSRPTSKIDLAPVRNLVLVTYPDSTFGSIQTAISPAAEPTTVSVAGEVATFSASPGATIADGTIIVIGTVGYTISGYSGGTTATLAGAPDVTDADWHTSASITRFGVRPLLLDYTGKTQVTTNAAAGNIADAARADWEDPGLEQTVELVGWWFLELWDFLKLNPDGIIHNEVTFGAVAGYSMSLANSKLTVVAQLRGRPNAGYRGWLRVGSGAGREPLLPEMRSLTMVFVEADVLSGGANAGLDVIFEFGDRARTALLEIADNPDLTAPWQSLAFDPLVSGTTTRQGFAFPDDTYRNKRWYARVTPYSGPFVVGTGVSGIAGKPLTANAYAGVEMTPRADFDVLDENVATIDADLTALANEPFTTHEPTLGLPNSRAWVDSTTATINRTAAGAIAIDVVGVEEVAGAVGEIGIPMMFYKTPLPASQWLIEGTIPATAQELASGSMRRQWYLVGARRIRIHAHVKSVTGAPTYSVRSSTDDFATAPTTCASLPISGTGRLKTDWIDLPAGAQNDVQLAPFLGDGAGTASAEFYALWAEVLPELVTAFRDFSDDFSDDFS